MGQHSAWTDAITIYHDCHNRKTIQKRPCGGPAPKKEMRKKERWYGMEVSSYFVVFCVAWQYFDSKETLQYCRGVGCHSWPNKIFVSYLVRKNLFHQYETIMFLVLSGIDCLFWQSLKIDEDFLIKLQLAKILYLSMDRFNWANDWLGLSKRVFSTGCWALSRIVLVYYRPNAELNKFSLSDITDFLQEKVMWLIYQMPLLDVKLLTSCAFFWT